MRRTALCLTLTAGLVSSLVLAAATPGNAAGGGPALRGALYQLAGTAGCMTEHATTGCATNANLYNPHSVSVSPDGKQVATVAGTDAVIIWNRGAGGKLTFARCVSKTGDASPEAGGYSCLANAQVGTPVAVLFTADGKSLLVISRPSGSIGAIVNFNRNPSTGALALNGTSPCINADGTGGCAKVRSMINPNVIAESPHQRMVYVGSSSGLVALSRDDTTLGLSKFGCLNAAGTLGCDTYAALEGVSGLAVDQASDVIWAASAFGGSLTSLYINTTGTGSLAPIQCYAASTTGCIKAKAVQAPTALALSPTSGTATQSIYLTDFNQDALVAFSDNNHTGHGIYGGCRSYTGNIPAATSTTCALDRRILDPRGLVVSPDGRNLYIGSDKSNPTSGAQLMAEYSRDPVGGTLAPLHDPYGCLRSANVGDTCAIARGMVGPAALAITPDGRNVYVADAEGNAVLSLHRALPPSCRAVHKHSRHDRPRYFTLHCKDPNADHLVYTFAAVKHGHLGKVRHGRVKFTPRLHFKGTASFKFSASDGGLKSAVYKDTLKTTKSHSAG